jgi:hypothetical protein
LPTEADPQPAKTSLTAKEETSNRTRLLNWTAIFFAALQSVCSAFIALSGVQLLIGASAFGAAVGALRIADHLHVPAIRIPMMLLALAGATWNLVALWRVWSLRRRPASAWRQRPVPEAKRRSELLQLVISVVTLLLLAIEEIAHHSQFHRF